MAIIQTPSAGIAQNIITGSGYASGDAIGDPFQIRLAAGGHGAWIGNVKTFDYASAEQSLRLELFNDEPSGFNPSGTPWQIADADDPKYLGYVDVTGWVSAGASKRVSTVNNPGVAIHAVNGNRSVWGQWRALASTTFGASANPLHVYMATIQDGM